MIEIENFEEFAAGLQQFITDTNTDWGKLFRQWVGFVFVDIVSTSPQWSGNFAANWNLNIGSPSSEYTDMSADDWRNIPGGAAFLGDTAAIQEAVSRNQVTMASITLISDVFINNLTPYAAKWVLSPGEFLRPGNYINPTPIPIGSALDRADTHLQRLKA